MSKPATQLELIQIFITNFAGHSMEEYQDDAKFSQL